MAIRIFQLFLLFNFICSPIFSQENIFKPIIHKFSKAFIDSSRKIIQKFPENFIGNSNTIQEVYAKDPIFNSNNLVKVLKFGDKYVYQGDILVNDENVITDSSQLRQSDGILRDTMFHWLDGIIPFTISNNFNHRDREKIDSAISYINLNTLFLLRPKVSSDYDYVEFVKVNMGCLSHVGRIGKNQPIEISESCKVGNIIHEILHAAGMIHEQSRNDRDNYVQINFSNIQPAMSYNFDKERRHTTSLGQYDFTSIMHYSLFAFANNDNEKTIIPKTILPLETLEKIGQRKQMSRGDINAANFLAKSNRSPVDSIVKPQNSGTICFKKDNHGDREFNGHGPKVKYNAEIVRVDEENSIDVVVNITLEETSQDYTKGKATYRKRIFTYEPEYTIREINNVLKENNDNNVIIGEAAKMQLFPFFCSEGKLIEINNSQNSRGIVKKIKLIADTGANDISDDNNCKCDSKILDIEFNNIEIILRHKN